MNLINGIPIDDYRHPDHPVEHWLIERWSPRSMSGEELPLDRLMSLFEAARWAPSCFNSQPWRFFYARRGTPYWDPFFGLLIEFNQKWAQNAAVLIIVCSRTTFEATGKPADTHSYDTGAAWQNLALQGTAMGLVVHGMRGFDKERAREVLKLPDEYSVEAMAAVGLPGDPADLPEKIREKEKPSGRKPVQEIAFEGPFPD